MTPATGIPTLSDITFPDATHGWAVGDHVILATADGGATWSSQTASADLGSVSFPDALHGWAVGAAGVDQEPLILHTGDGGSSWQTQYAGKALHGGVSRLHRCRLHRCRPRLGRRLERRVPGGGRSCRSSASPAMAALTGSSSRCRRLRSVANAVSFVDAKHGWLVCAPYGDSSGSTILRTTDGGLTWKRQYTTNANVSLHDITFADARHGWAVGEAPNPKGACAVFSDDERWRHLEQAEPLEPLRVGRPAGQVRRLSPRLGGLRAHRLCDRRWRPALAGRAPRLRGPRGGLHRPEPRLGYGRDRRLGARRRRHPDDHHGGLPSRSVSSVSASVSASTFPSNTSPAISAAVAARKRPAAAWEVAGGPAVLRRACLAAPRARHTR